MTRAALRARAQSFDKLAADYDRLGDLGENHRRIAQWLAGVLPGAGGRALDLGCGTGRHTMLLADRFTRVDAVDLAEPMIELARARRPRPNVTYWRSDLHDVAGPQRYDCILSVLTLHHVPDLNAALSHIRSLLAPGGRVVIVDCYDICPDRPSAWWRLRLAAEAAVPLRLRLHALALLRGGRDVLRRGPVTAWEVYRLTVKREWLDHLVSDRMFSRDALQASCADLFPGARLEVLGGARGIGLVWDAP
ncbi:MAG TPA: class I SAM-dependent methyltransferase [Streptosporangiaceae bacterium]|nr:class I SAM-dependent methyltransferase [Streptosporangiaceae bacterium]